MKRFEPILAVIWVILVAIATILLLTDDLNGQDHALRLKNVAEVSGENVMLGDVLAQAKYSGAPLDLVLCRAPNPGAVRTLSASQIANMLKRQGFDFALGGPRQIGIVRLQRTIAAEDLRPFIAEAATDGTREIRLIKLQSAIFMPPDAGLALTGLKFDSGVGSYRASFAIMKDARKIAAFEAFVVLGPGDAPGKIEPAPEQAGSRSAAPRLAVLVHRGGEALMQIVGDGFSAALPVILLEDGAKEQVVRARDATSKKIFKAQVLGGGRLLEISREN